MRLAAVLHLTLVYQAEILSKIEGWERLVQTVQVQPPSYQQAPLT